MFFCFLGQTLEDHSWDSIDVRMQTTYLLVAKVLDAVGLLALLFFLLLLLWLWLLVVAV